MLQHRLQVLGVDHAVLDVLAHACASVQLCVKFVQFDKLDNFSTSPENNKFLSLPITSVYSMIHQKEYNIYWREREEFSTVGLKHGSNFAQFCGKFSQVGRLTLVSLLHERVPHVDSGVSVT